MQQMENTFGIGRNPENEAQRIAAVNRYSLLDTRDEHIFDHIAKLAVQVFKVPVCLISIVGAEDVVYKANIGLGKLGRRPRSGSMCTHTLLQAEPTVIENAALEQGKFTDPLLGKENGFMFYAGAPLINAAGHAIGVCCLLDHQPREFSTADREILRSMAGIAMNEMELSLAAMLESEKQQLINDLLQNSEFKARYLISEAPIAIGVMTGRELIVETANSRLLKIWGKTTAILGKPLHEALPEIEGQAFLQLLEEVYTTGKPFYGNEFKAVLEHDHQLQDVYVNFVYHPITGPSGQTSGIMVVANDVTEQIMARKQVEFNAHRLRSMVMTAPVGMTILRGKELIVEVANEPMLEIWNRTADEIVGRKIMDVFPELNGQPFPELLERVFSSGEAIAKPEIPVGISTTYGEDKRYYVDFKYAPLFDPQGNVEAVMVTVNNITDQVVSRKLLEESEEQQQSLNEELTATIEELAAANEELLTTNEELADTYHSLKNTIARLKDSESRFRHMIEQAPVAIQVLKGKDLVVEVVNPNMLRLIDRDAGIQGKPLLQALPELQGHPVLPMITGVFQTGKSYYSYETPVSLLRGGVQETGYFNFVSTPIKENGETTHILQVATEVTESLMIRKQLQKAEEMLRFSIEAANVGTWFIDVPNQEFNTSSSMKKLLDYTDPAEMTFKAIINLVSPEMRKMVVTALAATFNRGEDFNIECALGGRGEQKLRWVKAIGKVDHDPYGKLSHFSGVVFEITEQKQDEIRKNDFIAMVSHELKTPLTSLKGYMQLLTAKNKNTDEFTKMALEKGNVQIRKMTAMITSFLNVSRLESGKIHLDKQEFDMSALINEILDEVRMTTQSHEITLLPCQPGMVNADADKIGQVISNFLSNAVKYSPKGKTIEMNCQRKGNRIELSVKDHGIGIRPEDREKLFERFYRVDNQLAQHISGFGIGLYLCAEIIRRHNGQIWVESEPDQGSAFYFSIPVS